MQLSVVRLGEVFKLDTGLPRIFNGRTLCHTIVDLATAGRTPCCTLNSRCDRETVGLAFTAPSLSIFGLGEVFKLYRVGARPYRLRCLRPRARSLAEPLQRNFFGKDACQRSAAAARGVYLFNPSACEKDTSVNCIRDFCEEGVRLSREGFNVPITLVSSVRSYRSFCVRDGFYVACRWRVFVRR